MLHRKKKKMKKAKIKYNFEEDIFIARPLSRNYDSSFQIGDFIFDLNDKNIVVGMEILNASKIFGLSKIALKNMLTCKLEIIISDKFIKVDIQVKSNLRNNETISNLSIERVRPEFVNLTELQLAVI